MKLLLLQVGRPRDAGMAALHDRYAERIVRFGVEYRNEHVLEVRAGGRYSDEHVRRRESAALLARLPERGNVIALSPEGRERDTPGFARELERRATPQATLVLGGPLGLHPELTDRADAVWSLSRLTLPHELARVVLVEQLYRALTLLRGVPYHK